MNKITDIFNLEKRRDMMIALITAALALAGCQTQAVPSTSTAIPTRTEIPATATLTPTNTPEPTATATKLVLPDNAVRIVGGGYVYVENDKVMQVGEDGVTKEVKDVSTEVVFRNMAEAGAILKVLNSEAISKFKRLDFFPPGLYDPIYTGRVDSSRWQTLSQKSSCESELISVVGIPRAFAKVENKAKYPGYPELGVAFMEVNGYPGLVPVVLGAFDSAGDFATLIGIMGNYMPQGYHLGANAHRESLDPIYTSKLDWDGLRKVLINKIFDFASLISVTSDEMENLDYNHATFAPLTPDMEALRDKLLHLQAQIMGAAGHLIRTTHKLPLPNAGVLLDMVDDGSNGYFFVMPLPNTSTLIHTDLK